MRRAVRDSRQGHRRRRGRHRRRRPRQRRGDRHPARRRGGLGGRGRPERRRRRRKPSPSSRNAAGGPWRSSSTSPTTSRCARWWRARSTTTARSNGLHVNAADMSPEVLGVDGETDLLTIPLSVWQRTLDVNLTGFLLAARAVIPHLLEAAVVGSRTPCRTRSTPASRCGSATPTTKTALTAVTRHIASRWGREGIRCNSISPGIIARNEEIEAAMLASASEGAPLDTVPAVPTTSRRWRRTCSRTTARG